MSDASFVAYQRDFDVSTTTFSRLHNEQQQLTGLAVFAKVVSAEAHPPVVGHAVVPLPRMLILFSLAVDETLVYCPPRSP